MAKEIQRSRAIIIQGQKILLVKRTKPEEVYWACPGGIVEKGESLEQCLIREVKEETGLDVLAGDLFFQMLSQKPGFEGQREYFYLADVVGGKLGTGTGPELIPNSKYPGKYEFKWYDLAIVSDLDLRPKEIKKIILNKFL
ncbi:MAG: NUDIX domain-containing protein [Patescibacteria group bacterium]|nr:NUDIX domain-containing protein [Patescibacteria group bacterium]